jgi:LacI family transcriptional regulator
MKNREPIKIKDIAVRAGVSIGTVDRVIHNRGRVSEKARKKVMEVMEELDYHPNLNARVLASKKPLVIGVLLPTYRKGEYWELPNLGIREALEKYAGQGYHIEPVFRTYNSPETFYKEGMKLAAEGVDGVITNPATFRESIHLMRHFFQSNIPYILIDSDIYGTPSLTFIGKDPIQSGTTVARLIHQITQHIQGIKTIWIINLFTRGSQVYSLLGRESGFMSYFSGKGLNSQYAFQSFDLEEHGTQKEIDLELERLCGTGHPHAIYVTGSRAYRIAAALMKAGPGPKPLLIGHDMIRANLKGLEDESIDFLIEEESRRQGYLAVESMIRSLVHKEKIEKKQLMNFLVYTRENLPVIPADQG